MYNNIMKANKIIYDKLEKLTSNKFDDSSDIYNIGIDSLDLVELVTEVEDEFEVTMSDQELESLKTVGDIVKAFEKLIK